MKNYQFTIKFRNGKQTIVRCLTIGEAVILGSAYAIKQGWNRDIDLIIDERGNKAHEIKVKTNYSPYFE